MTGKTTLRMGLPVFALLLAGCGERFASPQSADPPSGGSYAAPATAQQPLAGVAARKKVPVPPPGGETRELLSPGRLTPPRVGRRVVPSHRTPRPIETGDSFPRFLSAPAAPSAPSPSPGPAALAPALVTGFEGLPDPGNVVPPDTMGAAGPTRILSTLNSDVGVFDKASGQPIGNAVDLAVFWQPLTQSLPPRNDGAPFDPRLMYDQGTGRFVFISLTGQLNDIGRSFILLAVSRDSAPSTAPADWNMWAIPADNNARQTTWADFPCLGSDGNTVYVTANMYDRSDFYVGSKVWAIPKPQLLPGNPPTPGLQWTEFPYPPGANSTLVPAHTFGPAPAEYIVYEHGFSTGGYIRNLDVARIDQAGWMALGSVPIRPYPVSPETWTAPQPDSVPGIELNDTRILGAVFRNGRLYVIHHVPGDATPRPEVAWYVIDPTTAPPSLLQQGRISDPSRSYYYPSIGVNAKGDVAAGFSGSSPTEFAGAYYTARGSSDPDGTMQPVGLLKQGADTYYKTLNKTSNRWGDYSATVVDPAEDLTFWTVQEYVAARNTWGTWWGRFHLSDIAASALSTSGIRVTWIDQFATETGFTVERSPDGTQGSYAPIAAGLPPGTTSYVDNGLPEATRYYYRVLVDQGIDQLGPDDTATLPAAPDNLAATKVSSSSIRLEWRDNSSGEAGYKVERGTAGTGFAVVATLPGNTTGYVDSGLPGSTTFRYRVVAFSAGGDSDPSNVAAATTDPAPSSGGGGCLNATGVPAVGDPVSCAGGIAALLLPAAVLRLRRIHRIRPGGRSFRHPAC